MDFPEQVFSVNRKSYTFGDLLFFRVLLQKDSYVYILNQQSSGSLHLLFPNSQDSENFFTKGSYRIPDLQAEYEFQIEDDIGEETFYLITSTRKISAFHIRNFRENESLYRSQWLRRFTAELYPWEWKIYEVKVNIVQK